MWTIGNDAGARIHQSGVDAACREKGSDDLAGKALAKREERIGAARSNFAYRGNAAQQLIQRVEVAFQFGMEPGEQPGSQQLTGGTVVTLAHGARRRQGGFPVTTAGSFTHGHQLVRDFGHGADHDDGLLGKTAAHDFTNAFHGGGILDRGTAKFHDDHRYPCALSSSALSSAAPAAPRMVLCERTVNFQSSSRQGRSRPTVTAMPADMSTSSVGWGRAGWSSRTIGLGGALGRRSS